MVTVQRLVKLKLFTFSTEDPGKNNELRVVLHFDTHLNLKGLCHGFNTDLKSQDAYLCHRKPKNNGPFFKTIAISEH